jgi:hypothetical protein
VDRRRHMEDTGPYSSGVVGRREGVAQAIQLTHQGCFPPQPPPLGAAESVRVDRRTRKVLFEGPHDLRRTFSLAGWSLPFQ